MSRVVSDTDLLLLFFKRRKDNPVLSSTQNTSTWCPKSLGQFLKLFISKTTILGGQNSGNYTDTNFTDIDFRDENLHIK